MKSLLYLLFSIVKCSDCQRWRREFLHGLCVECSMIEIEGKVWRSAENAIRMTLEDERSPLSVLLADVKRASLANSKKPATEAISQTKGRPN